MGVNSVFTLKIGGKHDLLTIFILPEDKNNTQLSLSCRAREVNDISQPILVTSLKFGDVTNL